MTRKLPEEERLARQRAARRAWNEAHPDYYAEYHQRNLEKNRERNRTNNHKRKEAQAAEAEKRQRDLERLREWSRKNPEKRREARERYKAEHSEKYKAAQREYYHRNREAILERRKVQGQNPEMLRAAGRRYREANKERLAEAARQRRTDPEQAEKYRAIAERKRLARKRQAAGLPARRLRRTLAVERRANLAAAETFFSRERSRAELRRLAHGDVAPGLVQGWAQYSARVRRRAAFRAAVQAHIDKFGAELRANIEFDSRARQLRGKDPLDADAEVLRRATAAVLRANQPQPDAETTPPAPAAQRPRAARSPQRRTPPPYTGPVVSPNSPYTGGLGR